MELTAELDKLHEVQKVDLQIYQREQAITMLDDGEILKQAAIALMKRFDAASAERHKLEAAQRDHELALKSVEAKRDAVHEKLYSGRVHNPKELGDLQLEEELLNMHIHELEGPLLELMEQAEAARDEERVLAEQLAVAKRRWRETVARTQQETARLQAELAALRPQRDAAAQLVDKMLLRRYDDIRSRREGIGMAVTGTDNCPACHVRLTPRLLLQLREGEELSLCENCGRILHLVC